MVHFEMVGFVMVRVLVVFLVFGVAVEAVALDCSSSLVLLDAGSGRSGQRWMDAADNLYASSYRDSYDYTQAEVNISYTTDANMLYGTISGSDLKPNFLYQFKLSGTSGTASNELIGLTGRWWQEEWNGSGWVNGHNLNNKDDGSSPNPNDAVYFSLRDVNDVSSPTGKRYRFTGYLVFEYFLTDANGDATVAFEVDSSYHVLWKTSQRTHSSDDGPVKSSVFDPNTSSDAYDYNYGESSAEVFGEWERLPVGGVYLPAGDYNATFQLTEESFHNCGVQYAGGWATVMSGGAYFSIPVCIVDFDKLDLLGGEWLTSGDELVFDWDDSNTVDLVDYGIFANYWLDCCPNQWWLE